MIDRTLRDKSSNRFIKYYVRLLRLTVIAHIYRQCQQLSIWWRKLDKNRVKVRFTSVWKWTNVSETCRSSGFIVFVSRINNISLVSLEKLPFRSMFLHNIFYRHGNHCQRGWHFTQNANANATLPATLSFWLIGIEGRDSVGLFTLVGGCIK